MQGLPMNPAQQMQAQQAGTQQLNAGQGAKSLQLKKGQVFQGHVVKLFPQSLAALQLQGQTVTARLEAALTAGERYTFQVQQADGIPRLQVLDANTERPAEQRSPQGAPAQGSSSDAQQLLRQLAVSDSRAHQELLQHMQREQQPFTREQLQAGGQLLRQMNDTSASAMQQVQTMMMRNMPMTETVFRSVQALNTNESLSQQLQQLQQQAAGELQNSRATTQQQQALQQLLEGLQAARREGAAVVQQGAPTPASESERLTTLMQQMASSGREQAGAEDLLRRLGAVPQGMSRDEMFAQFKQNVLSRDNEAVVRQLWPFLSNSSQGTPLARMEPQQLFQFLMQNMAQDSGREGEQLRLLQQLLPSGANVTQAAQNLTNALQQNAAFSEGEQRALQQMLTQQGGAGRQEGSFTPGQLLSRAFEQLGLRHEQQISQGMEQGGGRLQAGGQEGQQQLKPALLAQLASLPDHIRPQAEQLVHRLTGAQLFGQDQQGPLSHTALQLPVGFGDFYTDVSMQWEGRRQSNGQIDPDHARVLFYLNLEQLGSTMVDVQIQNRIVSIQVMNDTPEPAALTKALKPHVKSRLEAMGYTLSGIHWRESAIEKAEPAPQSYPQSSFYEGFDVRV